nr:hypothetical protein [Rhodothermus marinus]
MAKPVIGKQAIDKVFAEKRIAQAPLFFHGKQRQPADQCVGEESATFIPRHSVLVVHLYAKQATGRGAAFQNEAVEIHLRNLLGLGFAPGAHGVGPVAARV